MNYNFHLATAIYTPLAVLDFSYNQWDLLIRQARTCNLLARLGFFLEGAGIFTKLPKQPLLHIRSAQFFFERFSIALHYEIHCIQEALSDIDLPLILLKGTAYAVSGDAAAIGRSFSDIDILVPEDRIREVENALIKAGWMTSTLDPYDQKYYRQWMHEIPPMRHLKRQTTIDVHHNILPKTARFCPDATKILANIVKIPEKNIWVLSPEDKVLHSATHLFHEGEFVNGFRDLSDLDLLLKEFAVQDDFWQKLHQRAADLKQTTPLYYAFRYTKLILQTPIPDDVLALTQRYGPGVFKRDLMDALFLRALMPNHESCADRWTGLARWLLFIRSHWLKMPFHLLVMHLSRKAYKRALGRESH